MPEPIADLVDSATSRTPGIILEKGQLLDGRTEIGRRHPDQANARTRIDRSHGRIECGDDHRTGRHRSVDRHRPRDGLERGEPNLERDGAGRQLVRTQTRTDQIGQTNHLGEDLVVRHEIGRERLFLADRLRIAVRLDGTRVMSRCQLGEVSTVSGSHGPFEDVDRERSEVGHGADSETFELGQGGRSHSPQRRHRKRMNECDFASGFDDENSRSRQHTVGRGAGFGGLRRQLGHELVGRHAHRRRQIEFVGDALPNQCTDGGAVSEESTRSGHVEKRFVECDGFDERSDVVEDRVDLCTHVRIVGVITGQKDGLRTTLARRSSGHGREHPEATSFVVGRRHHPSATRTSDHHGLAGQLGMPTHLHRHVERVHVDVQDRACHKRRRCPRRQSLHASFRTRRNASPMIR